MLGEQTRLVVAAQHKHPIGMIDLKRHQVKHRLAAKRAAIDIVAQEQILVPIQRAGLIEHVDHVVELTVDVAEHEARRGQLERVGLGLEQRGAPLQQRLASLCVPAKSCVNECGREKQHIGNEQYTSSARRPSRNRWSRSIGSWTLVGSLPPNTSSTVSLRTAGKGTSGAGRDGSEPGS